MDPDTNRNSPKEPATVFTQTLEDVRRSVSKEVVGGDGADGLANALASLAAKGRDLKAHQESMLANIRACQGHTLTAHGQSLCQDPMKAAEGPGQVSALDQQLPPCPPCLGILKPAPENRTQPAIHLQDEHCSGAEAPAVLQQNILSLGVARGPDLIDLGAFLTKQVDVSLLHDCASYIADYCQKNLGQPAPNKVITAESGGIAIGTLVALCLGIPLVVCKKGPLPPDQVKPEPVAGALMEVVQSFTKGNTYVLSCSAEHLSSNDAVIFVDDFLACGQALEGIAGLCNQAGASLRLAVFLVEKTFQGGLKVAESLGLDVLSLARLKAIQPDIRFW
eukprot:gene216-2374_t